MPAKGLFRNDCTSRLSAEGAFEASSMAGEKENMSVTGVRTDVKQPRYCSLYSTGIAGRGGWSQDALTAPPQCYNVSFPRGGATNEILSRYGEPGRAESRRSLGHHRRRHHQSQPDRSEE